MAKFLVWLFVGMHSLNVVSMYSSDAEITWKNTLPVWIGIGVIAICDSISKSNKK